MKVSSFDNENLSMPEQHLENSESYFYCAKLLCQHLIAQPEILSYSKGSVCMFNARLSIELFLKAVIIKNNSNLKLNHSIELLRDQYFLVYPEKKYYWDIPYTVEFCGYEEAEYKDLEKKHNQRYPQDQILRYPMNNKKNPWNILAVFSPSEFLKELESIELDITRIKGEIFS